MTRNLVVHLREDEYEWARKHLVDLFGSGLAAPFIEQRTKAQFIQALAGEEAHA